MAPLAGAADYDGECFAERLVEFADASRNMIRPFKIAEMVAQIKQPAELSDASFQQGVYATIDKDLMGVQNNMRNHKVALGFDTELCRKIEQQLSNIKELAQGEMKRIQGKGPAPFQQLEKNKVLVRVHREIGMRKNLSIGTGGERGAGGVLSTTEPIGVSPGGTTEPALAEEGQP